MTRPSTSHPHLAVGRNINNRQCREAPRSLVLTFLVSSPYCRIGYDLEACGPGWGVRPSSEGWSQKPRGEDGDFPPDSAGWEPGPSARTSQEGYYQQLLWHPQAFSRPSLHVLPDPPHPRRAQGSGCQYTRGEVLFMSCVALFWSWEEFGAQAGAKSVKEVTQLRVLFNMENEFLNTDQLVSRTGSDIFLALSAFFALWNYDTKHEFKHDSDPKWHLYKLML